MPIPIIIQKILENINSDEVNNTILTYYKSFGSNPKILDDMIKTYISVIINEKINSYHLINDNNLSLFS
jgi:hypothetical protein